MRKIINIKFHLIILSAIIFSGCTTIKEDMSDCDRYIKFNFDYHMGDNNFDNDIDIIGMYIFDVENRFLEVRSVKVADLTTGNIWPLNIEGTDWTGVVWAGLEGSDRHLSSPVMTIGDSIEKLIFELNLLVDNSSTTNLSPLFWGGQELLTFTENNNTTQTFDLLRDNNLVNLTVNDQHGVPLDLNGSFVAEIKATNAKYKSDNSIATDSPMAIYQPTNSDGTSSNIYTYSTLRFVESYSDDVVLTILNTATGQYVKFENDTEEFKLLNHLSTPASRPSGMGMQEHLDRESIWDVEFDVVIPESEEDPIVVVTVTVNGWITYIQREEL